MDLFRRDLKTSDTRLDSSQDLALYKSFTYLLTYLLLFHSVYGHQDTDWLCDAPLVFQ